MAFRRELKKPNTNKARITYVTPLVSAFNPRVKYSQVIIRKGISSAKHNPIHLKTGLTLLENWLIEIFIYFSFMATRHFIVIRNFILHMDYCTDVYVNNKKR